MLTRSRRKCGPGSIWKDDDGFPALEPDIDLHVGLEVPPGGQRLEQLGDVVARAVSEQADRREGLFAELVGVRDRLQELEEFAIWDPFDLNFVAPILLGRCRPFSSPEGAERRNEYQQADEKAIDRLALGGDE
jgi:hypothetical protein